MPGKECSVAIMKLAINNRIDRMCGKGWMFVHAIRIEADFSKERYEDKTCVDTCRLMVFPAQGEKWTFRSSRLHLSEDCTYHTSQSWADSEVKQAYETGDYTRMLDADSLEEDVYYIIYHDESFHWKCREVEDAVNRLVRGVMHEDFQANYVCKDKHMAKSITETEQRKMAFKDIMMSELLPAMHRLFMVPRAGFDDTVELDPMRVGENLDSESASVFVAHAN